MAELLNEKKRGLKLTIIDKCDYPEFREVCDMFVAKGYSVTIIDNGNVILERSSDGNNKAQD